MWLTIVSLTAEAQGLGRLFFTPQQRAALEAPRVTLPAAREGVERSGMAAVRLNGWINAGGRRRFWIDRKPYDEGQPRFRPRLEGMAAVIDWRGRRVRLRPGQVLRPGADGRWRVEESGDEE